jgi:hypothetical protein
LPDTIAKERVFDYREIVHDDQEKTDTCTFYAAVLACSSSLPGSLH